MGRAKYLVAAIVLVSIAGLAVWAASARDPEEVSGNADIDELLAREPGPAAPELTAARGWLNSEPLGAAEIEGKVVMYDFWTYSCINCVRTIPFLRSWHERYADDGLIIVGVHSPEFEFEKDHDNVEREVADLEVTWPVAFDDEMDIWRAFGNQFWPAKYVFDRENQLRFTHFGEGAYEETEDLVRALLGVDPSSPRADDDAPDGDGVLTLTPCPAPASVDEDCLTPETYMGALRGVPSFTSPEGLMEGAHEFTLPEDQPRHTVALSGQWFVNDESATSVGTGTELVLRYTAAEVNLVMAPPVNGPVEVELTLDGEPVPAHARTVDLVDDDGATIVVVDESDLYRLVLTLEPGPHELVLRPRAAGVQAFAFTYSG